MIDKEINLIKHGCNSISHSEILDIIRGGAIILVVLGHTYTPLLVNYIYCFHVAIFFIISGICINPKYTESIVGGGGAPN